MSELEVALLTREYPPEIYGGAGVHVEYLVRALGERLNVRVHCFGRPRSVPEVEQSYAAWEALAGGEPHLLALRTLSVDLLMAAGVKGASLVHSHTWYANFGGHLAKLVWGIPHVMTSHSLEPLRPWKAEQLGGGYAVSSFCEKIAIQAADAVIAVSQGMKRDILRAYPDVLPERVHVIHNGIDTAEYRPVTETDVLDRYGIDRTRPYFVFVGRITRQKGVVHLLEAVRMLRSDAALVLCAGEPDTPEIAAEVKKLVSAIDPKRVVWIEQMLPRPEVVQILSHSSAFVCPSVYEPFGIVNLEAMACGAPVIASAVGGIPEIVVEGVTGFLVEFEPDGSEFGTPRDPQAFARALAERIDRLTSDPALGRRMGAAGRQRVVAEFSWGKVAERTAALYRGLLSA
jgi:starch synthase